MEILSQFLSRVNSAIDFSKKLVYNIVMLKSYEEVEKQAKELSKLARKMRREEMQKFRDEGLTLEEIGKQYDPPLTKERVRKILEGDKED